MLYFAYTARIAPMQMAEVAPGAEFQFIAHLPHWGLEFPMNNRMWKGALPTVKREEKRHQVTVHLHEGRRNGTYPPSPEYLELMLSGSRHWSLPAGWIAGLEEHLRNGA